LHFQIQPRRSAQDSARTAQDGAHGQREAKSEEGRDLGRSTVGTFGCHLNTAKNVVFFHGISNDLIIQIFCDFSIKNGDISAYSTFE
jgi:hypothetical protein